MIEALANHLWQSTLIALLIAILCYWLRRDGAHVRYWLWWIASIKFLVPFSLLTAIGARLAGDRPVAIVPEIWTIRAEVVANPFADSAFSWPGAILVGLWAVGAIVLLARWLVGANRLRRLLARAVPAETLTVDGGRPIRVYRSPERVEPGIVGIFRPVLLLPQDIDDRLSPAKLEAVLRHEVGHVHRHDNLLAAAHMLVEIVFWFHPFVWWIGARLIDERERACDELVVASGHDPEIYAEGILDVCEHYAASPLRCAAGISGSDLKKRITEIMRYPGMKSLKLAKKSLLVVVSVIALAIPLLAGLAVQQTAFAQDDATAPRNVSIFDVESTNPNDYLPIVKVAPVYPPRAAARGLEGYVVVEYTVNSTGATENVSVVESSSTLFERAAVESAMKYKYKPRVDNGTPVAVPGVRTRIEFALEDEQLPVSQAAQEAAAAAAAAEE